VSARRVLVLGLVLFAALASAAGARADEAKVLRVALQDIASLDPQQITDLNSERVANAIFEGLYQFDYLAAPARIVPNTAAAMPEIADNGRTWTIRIKPGILFASAPAFNGKPRELTAQDYVYSITPRLDPNLERILSLRPDLVAVYGSQQDLKTQLARASIPVYSYRHAGLADITSTIRDIGERAGHGLVDRPCKGLGRTFDVGRIVAQHLRDFANAVGDRRPACLRVGERLARAAREIRQGVADGEEQHVRVT